MNANDEHPHAPASFSTADLPIRILTRIHVLSGCVSLPYTDKRTRHALGNEDSIIHKARFALYNTSANRTSGILDHVMRRRFVDVRVLAAVLKLWNLWNREGPPLRITMLPRRLVRDCPGPAHKRNILLIAYLCKVSPINLYQADAGYPLKRAAFDQNYDLATYLFRRAPGVWASHAQAIYDAIRNDDVKMMKLLIEGNPLQEFEGKPVCDANGVVLRHPDRVPYQPEWVATASTFKAVEVLEWLTEAKGVDVEPMSEE